MKRRTFIQAVLGAASFAGLVRFRVPPRAPRQRAGVRCVWQQNVSGDWNDPRNWLNGRVPREGDDVTIPAFTVATIPADAPVLRTLKIEGTIIMTHNYPGRLAVRVCSGGLSVAMTNPVHRWFSPS